MERIAIFVQMKRIIAISLASYLLLLTVGVNVYAHFCGTELCSTSIVSKTNTCCPGEDEAGKTDDCCSDKVKKLQLDTDYLLAKSSTIIAHFCAILPFTSSFIFSQEELITYSSSSIKGAPPLVVDAVIHYCNIRI